MNTTIEFETKSHYGGPELIYVTSEHKKALEDLTGKKTLTSTAVKALKELGFEFKEKRHPEKVMAQRVATSYLSAIENKTVGINDFVKRQTKADFAGTKVSMPQLEKLQKIAEKAVNTGQDKRGYANFVRIVDTKDPSILCPIAKITAQNKKFLKTEKTKRREGEEEYEQRYFDSKDVKGMPSHHVSIIMYTKEQLDKEGEKNTGSDLDIISINAEINSKGAPITPETMRRNIKGPQYGGSGYQHTKKEIGESEAFWNQYAMIK